MCGNVDMQKRKTVVRKLTPADKTRIKLIATHKRHLSNTQIATRAHLKGSPMVSRHTIGRVLKSSNYGRELPKSIPFIKPVHKASRVAWCLKYRDFDWSHVVFSDESSFQMHSHKIKLIFKKNLPRPTTEKPKHAPSVMVWGAISAAGASTLALTRDTINSSAYTKILEEYLVSNMDVLYKNCPTGWFLMQDNSPVHVSKESRAWFAREGIQLIDWPPNSPDLNPIENLWGVMKRELSKVLCGNISQFKAEIEKLWNIYAPTFIDSFNETMRGRIELCLEKNGDYIGK